MPIFSSTVRQILKTISKDAPEIASKVVQNRLHNAGKIKTSRVGDSTGIFYGNKISGSKAMHRELPTRGADVGYYGPVEHTGTGGNAPVADAVGTGQIPLDKDILQLMEHFSPQDQTWAEDLAGLISLKRSGKEVAHFTSNNMPTAVVSTDLRHVKEQELLKNFVKMLMTKTENEPFNLPFYRRKGE